jgi:hypothetical protein
VAITGIAKLAAFQKKRRRLVAAPFSLLARVAYADDNANRHKIKFVIAV